MTPEQLLEAMMQAVDPSWSMAFSYRQERARAALAVAIEAAAQKVESHYLPREELANAIRALLPMRKGAENA